MYKNENTNIPPITFDGPVLPKPLQTQKKAKLRNALKCLRGELLNCLSLQLTFTNLILWYLESSCISQFAVGSISHPPITSTFLRQVKYEKFNKSNRGSQYFVKCKSLQISETKLLQYFNKSGVRIH